jgi:hypothetical protein
MIRRNLHAIHACAVILVLVAAARGQSLRFDPVLENPRVSVFSLDLPPGRRASVFQNTHDIFWIALSPGHVTMADEDGNKTPVNFRDGDTRFYSSFRTSAITNDDADTFHAMLVEIKPRGLASSCDCDGAAQRAVCGCPGAAPLPGMWAVGIGAIVVGGTTLAPGESFRQASDRGDTVLVAVSPLTLSDDASGKTLRINLRPGEARWLPAGLHRLRNTGPAPARYVTLEF